MTRLKDATRIVLIWPYGTTVAWIAESHVISGFGMGYPTRHFMVRKSDVRR